LIDWGAMSSNWHQKRLAFVSTILLLNIAGFFYYIYFLTENGYLPSPFLYDKSDTFMDLFNVLYWTYDDGRYTEWGSVYPPINFIFLRFFNFVFVGSVFGDAALMRENSQFVIAGVCLIYLTIPALILKLAYWRDFTRNEKILIYFAIVLSSPLLFTLERGNVILMAPLILALAISKIGVARIFSIALLINIKPYFALLMIYYIARNNWKGFVTCSLLSGLIFAITGLVLDNQFLEFFRNLFSYSQETELYSLREVMALPSSVSAFSYILRHLDEVGVKFDTGSLSTGRIEAIVYLVEITKWGVLAIALAALFMRSKQMRDMEIFTSLVVVISNLGIWVGGYTFILYVTLIPMFISMRNKWLYISLLSLIAMPLDVIPMMSDYIGMHYSYLAAEHIEIMWTLGLGSVIRPLANVTLLILLTYEFLARKNEVKSNNLFRDTGFSDSFGFVEKKQNDAQSK
jgi:hypothetical protein